MANDTVAREPHETPEAGRPVRPRRLIVLAPGFNGRCSLWAPLKRRLAEESQEFGAAEAQWLDFDHRTSRWTIGTVSALAEQLHARIVAEWLKAGGFDEIVLVGHSMGGLLVRQAYLLAVGAVAGQTPSAWGERVVRIVLLASLNRGIETKRTIGTRAFSWMTRVVPFVPHLRMQDVFRGSDLLTNLRINWIRHFGKLADAELRGESGPDGRIVSGPLVIQLLGSRDSIVHRDDSKDVLAFPGGHYLDVPDADHRTLYRLDCASEPDLRFAVLRQGFIGRPTGLGEVSASTSSDPVKRVVFLLHGIRASNVDEWIKGLEERILARDPTHILVRHPTYGYFTAARFALPTVRRRNIRMFQDWYTEALAEHPKAEFSIIAHSNGTYILGNSLLATPGMRFAHVVLAGSVLPRAFPWRERRAQEQVARVRNDRANRDWPVALLCSALRGLRMKDVGTGGFEGFEGASTEEIAYYRGGHGQALMPECQESLVDFVLGKPLQKPARLEGSPGYFRQLSNVMPYFAALAAVSMLGGMLWLILAGRWSEVLTWAVACIGAYIVLDIV